MSKVLIIVNADVESGKVSQNAPVVHKMVTALSKSIKNTNNFTEIETISGAQLWSKSIELSPSSEDLIYCPLTIKIPDWLEFPAQNIYQMCMDKRKTQLGTTKF